jgi:hypothetical protein
MCFAGHRAWSTGVNDPVNTIGGLLQARRFQGRQTVESTFR